MHGRGLRSAASGGEVHLHLHERAFSVLVGLFHIALGVVDGYVEQRVDEVIGVAAPFGDFAGEGGGAFFGAEVGFWVFGVPGGPGEVSGGAAGDVVVGGVTNGFGAEPCGHARHGTGRTAYTTVPRWSRSLRSGSATSGTARPPSPPPSLPPADATS